MKFSIFAGVAALATGVLAVPHVTPRTIAPSAPVARRMAKRAALSSAVSNMQNEVDCVSKSADDVTSLLSLAIGGNSGDIAKITVSLLDLNSTLGNVVDILSDLGLSSVIDDVDDTVSDVVSDAGSVVKHVFGGVSRLLGGVLSDATSLLGGSSSTTTTTTTTNTTTSAGGSTTDITTTITSLSDATNLAGMVGTVLATVGGLLNNITICISLGNLGNVTDLSSTVATADGTLQTLLGTVAGLLTCLLSNL